MLYGYEDLLSFFKAVRFKGSIENLYAPDIVSV
jgi:hypothetical protein